jgi:hypothetical protein
VNDRWRRVETDLPGHVPEQTGDASRRIAQHIERLVADDHEAQAIARPEGQLRAEYMWPPEDPGVHGEPQKDAALWHEQGDNSHSEVNTCAVVAQEMVVYKFTGDDPGENACLEVALENGWYDEGTAPGDVGKILGEYGIDYHVSHDNSLEDLAKEIDQGHGVVVGVESDVLWFDDLGMGRANHAICVTGYERTEDGRIAGVYVNDSGEPSGACRYYDADQFSLAFVDAGGMVVATDQPAPGLASTAGATSGGVIT